MPVTRTLGPLHFEDLEPKRFEDLVRQLAYDFKLWRRLEATGRAGSDDGFDARGFEIVQGEPSGEVEDQDVEVGASDRLWLIQCKRERTISPAKLSAYLQDIRLGPNESLYGIVFAAACDFSMKSRKLFRQCCEAQGIQEWHLWGKAELEDLLFQPRNDGLLFAYFGLSLTIRRRSQRAELRSKLAIKRKAKHILEDKINHHILLRSPDAHEYPSSKAVQSFATHPTWILRSFEGTYYSGLLFSVRRYYAYLSDDRNTWDAALICDLSRSQDDRWTQENEDRGLGQEIYAVWSKFPVANRAFLNVYGLLPYENIVDIDELGDELVDAPHIYVPFHGPTAPFATLHVSVKSSDKWVPGSYSPRDFEEGRTHTFKEEWRSRPPR